MKLTPEDKRDNEYLRFVNNLANSFSWTLEILGNIKGRFLRLFFPKGMALKFLNLSCEKLKLPDARVNVTQRPNMVGLKE